MTLRSSKARVARTTPIEKTRIGGSRSRHGCTTCRARRVKCDERKPICLRCVKTRNTCGGYITTSSEERTEPPSLQFVYYGHLNQAFDGHPEMSLQEEAALHHFVTTVMADFRRPFDSRLWTTVWCGIAQNEKIVRSGLIALASFHNSFIQDEQGESEGVYARFAWLYYGQMISEWRNMTQDSTERSLTTLVTCLIFCAIESLRGHFASALRFIKQGVAVLTAEANQATVKGSNTDLMAMPEFDELCPLFVDMSSQAMAMHGSGHGDYTYLSAENVSPATGIAFRSPKVALAELSILMNDLFRFSDWARATGHDSDFPCASLQKARTNMKSRYQEWASAFYSMLHGPVQHMSHDATGVEDPAATILRAYQLVCCLILDTSFDLGQTCFDRYTDTFKAILECAESFLTREAEYRRPFYGYIERPYFGLSCGIIPALFFIAFRCRFRNLRYHALTLLQSTRRREGIWDSVLVAQALKLLINIEEAGARQNNARKTGVPAHTIRIVYPEDIPDETRIESVNMNFTERGNGTINIKFVTGETTAPIPINGSKYGF